MNTDDLATLLEKADKVYKRLKVDHTPILDSTRKIAAALAAGDTAARILPLFDDYERQLLDHFLEEEALFSRLPKSAQGHIERHTQTHNDLRRLLDYTRMKLMEAGAGALPPNVMPILPAKYLEEMLDQDLEMSDLLSSE